MIFVTQIFISRLSTNQSNAHARMTNLFENPRVWFICHTSENLNKENQFFIIRFSYWHHENQEYVLFVHDSL